MARENNQEINAGSMADIAFLLLIFFLVTTTMDTDSGITRVLPPMPEEDQEKNDDKIKERNLLIVLINKSDRLLVNGEEMQVGDLREHTKKFILNPMDDENLPEKDRKIIMVKNPDYLEGSSEPKKIEHALFLEKYPNGYPVSKGVVSLQNDRGTSYKRYIEVQNELVAAYNEVRDELSMRMFKVHLDELTEETDLDAVRTAIPQRISEAEPKNIGG